MNQNNTSNSTATAVLKSALFCILFTGLFVGLSYLKSFVPLHLERIAHGLLGTFAALLTTYLFLQFDKKSFASIGLRLEQSTIWRFFAGVVIGVLIMGSLLSIVVYLSHLQVERNPNSTITDFLLLTLPLIPLAFMEELGFRAYSLRTLENKVDIRLSLLITSFLFALYHVANGWSLVNSFIGPGIWGLVFGIAAIYSRGIAMPTGIHYAANLTTAAFAMENTSVNIWTLKQNSEAAPAQFHGIKLASIVPNLCLFVLAVILIEMYIRRGER